MPKENQYKRNASGLSKSKDSPDSLFPAKRFPRSNPKNGSLLVPQMGNQKEVNQLPIVECVKLYHRVSLMSGFLAKWRWFQWTERTATRQIGDLDRWDLKPWFLILMVNAKQATPFHHQTDWLQATNYRRLINLVNCGKKPTWLATYNLGESNTNKNGT